MTDDSLERKAWHESGDHYCHVCTNCPNAPPLPTMPPYGGIHRGTGGKSICGECLDLGRKCKKPPPLPIREGTVKLSSLAAFSPPAATAKSLILSL